MAELIFVTSLLHCMAPSTIPFALVVDDDPIILMNVSDILSEAGFRPLEAYTADEAVGVLAGHNDSVVLLFTDVEMPGDMNGFGLAQAVASRWPEIEIVVASGRAKPTHSDMPAKATFIAKPFTADVVLDHLREHLPDGKKPEPLKNAV